MGRPSKLTNKQKSEIQRRRINGEGVRDLAKVFKVSPATISVLVTKRTKTIKALAKQLVTVESKLEELSVSEQIIVRNLADQLRGISDGLATAGNQNAQTSAHLAKVAYGKARMLTDDCDEADLKVVAVLVESSNRASMIGVNLLNATKDQAIAGEPTLEQLVTGTK